MYVNEYKVPKLSYRTNTVPSGFTPRNALWELLQNAEGMLRVERGTGSKNGYRAGSEWSYNGIRCRARF